MNCKYIICGLLSVSLCNCKGEEITPTVPATPAVTVQGENVEVTPYIYSRAFRNPMKGWRDYYNVVDVRRGEYPEPYGAMIKEYMQWNKMESVASDDLSMVVEYTNHRWKDIEKKNVKVIPRPYIVWRNPWLSDIAPNPNYPDDLRGWYWPTDIPEPKYKEDENAIIADGYSHPDFQERVVKFVEKLGAAWDNDPRVAYIEMGIIGEWGEHHDPSITTYWAPHTQDFHVADRTWIPGIEKTLGDAFKKAFKNKKVMVRYAYDFKDYQYGIYWDSWVLPEEDKRGYEEMMKLGDRWRTQPIGGEATFGRGTYNAKYGNTQKGVAAPEMLERFTHQFRELHCNHLGGITSADFNDPAFRANADVLQMVMGYRFVIDKFSYPKAIKANESFSVSLNVSNIGSSPFYYDWPVEIALLDPATKEVVWREVMESAKISQWMPGDAWSRTEFKYLEEAKSNSVTETFTIDDALPAGKYIISLSVLDPAGMVPSLRFATAQYFKGGRHPMGYISVGEAQISDYTIPYSQFNDIYSDTSLYYVVE